MKPPRLSPEPMSDPRMPMAKVEERQWFRGLVIGFAVMSTVGVITIWILSEAKAQTAEGVAAIDAKVGAQVVAHEAYVKRNDEAVGQLRSDNRNTQLDVRELYNAWRFDRRSARLEQPPPAIDGGSRAP